MAGKPGLTSPLQILGKRVSAESDEENVFQGFVGPEGPRHLVAIHAGQTDITKHDFRLKMSRLGQALGTSVRDFDLVRADFEHGAQTVGRIDVVLDDKHTSAARLLPGCIRVRRQGRRRVEGQLDDELRSLAGTVAVRADLPTMHLHESLHQR